MKAAPVVSTYTVAFTGKSPRPATRAATGRVPRVVRMLAMAHKIDGMILDGELKDLADAARAIGVTRARMTQIANLLLLAPEIQEAILNLPPITNGKTVPEKHPELPRKPARKWLSSAADQWALKLLCLLPPKER